MLRAVRQRSRSPSPAAGDGRSPAWVAGLMWLIAGLSAGYWVLQVWGRGPVATVPAMAPPATATDPAALARALGAMEVPSETAAAPVVASSRWRLLGVVSRPGERGAALLALDDQPPRPYVVGASLEGGLVLQSVDRQGVRIGVSLQGPASLELRLPEPPAN